MRDWREYHIEDIRSGKDENGNKLKAEFLKDYRELFPKTEIIAGCPRCFENYYKNLIKKLNIMSQLKQNSSGFVLHTKYEGIPLSFGSAKRVTNQNITKEDGEKMLKEHPLGKKLFAATPSKSKSSGKGKKNKTGEGSKKETNSGEGSKKTTSESLTKQDLRNGKKKLQVKILEDLGLDPDDYANENERISAILEEKAKVSSESAQENGGD